MYGAISPIVIGGEVGSQCSFDNSGYLQSLYKYLIHTFEITNAMQDNLVVWLKEKEN